MEAFTEFLTENSQRSYPLIEDQNNTFPFGILLDFRGFSRERPDIAPQLLALVGGEAGGENPTAPIAGFYSLYFTTGRQESPLIFGVKIPETNQVWPFISQVSIADSNYPERNVHLAMIRVMVGYDITLWDKTQRVDFNGNTLIEPALMSQLYRTQVDFLKIIHENSPSEFVGGKLVIHGGYSVEATTDNNGISLNAIPGAGELGMFTGSSLPPSQACAGGLLSINRITANNRGIFSIQAQNGLTVNNLPEQHKIQLIETPATLGQTICP